MPTKGWHEWEALLFFHQSQELECRSTAKLHSMLKGERLLPHIRMTTIGVGQASFLLHQFTRLCINIGPLGFFSFSFIMVDVLCHECCRRNRVFA